MACHSCHKVILNNYGKWKRHYELWTYNTNTNQTNTTDYIKKTFKMVSEIPIVKDAISLLFGNYNFHNKNKKYQHK